MDDVHYETTVERIDRLMTVGKLTKGQELYLETLVQLVQAYEAKHHAIDTPDLSGVAALQAVHEDERAGPVGLVGREGKGRQAQQQGGEGAAAGAGRQCCHHRCHRRGDHSSSQSSLVASARAAASCSASRLAEPVPTPITRPS